MRNQRKLCSTRFSWSDYDTPRASVVRFTFCSILVTHASEWCSAGREYILIVFAFECWVRMPHCLLLFSSHCIPLRVASGTRSSIPFSSSRPRQLPIGRGSFQCHNRFFFHDFNSIILCPVSKPIRLRGHHSSKSYTWPPLSFHIHSDAVLRKTQFTKPWHVGIFVTQAQQ